MKEHPKNITRRKAVKLGVGALGITAIGGIGWQFRSTKPAVFPTQALSPMVPQKQRLLVIYASMMGSTGDQAVIVAETARAAGFAAQVSKVDEAPDPRNFDSIVLMSAIRGSAWLDEMVDYAAGYEKEIAARPHALLQCSMTCAGLLQSAPELSNENRAYLRKDMDSLLTAAPSLEKAPYDFLAGRLDFDYLTPVLRFGYPIVSKSLLYGDFRDPVRTRKQFDTILATPAFRSFK